jgi:serine protease AprX
MLAPAWQLKEDEMDRQNAGDAPRRVQPRRGRRLGAAALGALASLAAIAPAAHAAPDDVRVVVAARPAAAPAAETAVRAAGGRVVRSLPIVHGVIAEVPAGALDDIRAVAGVRAVQPDRAFRLQGADSAEGTDAPGGVPLAQLRETMAADGSGAGVDVALIDSGITPVPALAASEKVVNGPDFSDDGADPQLRHLDAFGHGTHLAGIIAANGADEQGVAPASRLVNVKVANRDGSTSLSQLLAAIDWVVRNRSRGGLNIRVLNLSIGADADGSYRDDPLAFAVEQAWRHGIFVVTAAGNGGADTTSLDSPAVDPYVLAVGAADTLGTITRADDLIADFSSRGSAQRTPDVVAPGVGIVSLDVPGGFLDELFPQARVGDGGFRGSGTSQAAAAASGAAAVLIAQRPALNPDELKALLRASADPLPATDATLQGAGAIDVRAAASAPVPTDARQAGRPAGANGVWKGRSPLGAQLAVEQPRASRWSASRWSASRWSASRWSASRWSASRWSASRWSASRWSTAEWGDIAP